MAEPADRPPAATRRWRIAAIAVFALAGALFVTSSLNSKGLDLRAASVSDSVTVIRQERAHVNNLQDKVAETNAEITKLRGQTTDAGVRRELRKLDALRAEASFKPVAGEGMVVTLDDAPKSVRSQELPAGLTAEDLIVHQQDIQAVVNALLVGGATAVSLQNQRIIATSGIKCVGSTVRLHGVTYAPPYVIRAVGNPTDLEQALDDSTYVRNYLTYVESYQLGYDTQAESDVEIPAYDGSVDLRYAKAVAPPADREQ